MKTDTPRTDEATLRAIDIEGGGEFNAVHVQVSSRLERELTTAREEIEMLGIRYAAAEMHHANNMQEVTEQRDGLKQAVDCASDLLASVTEQRDRLAEALEHSMKHMRHSLNCPAKITEGLHPCNCQMEWAYDNATETLQSLTPNEL
jgi:hypothetical protein